MIREKEHNLLTPVQIEFLVEKLENGESLPKRREDIPDALPGALFSREEIMRMLEIDHVVEKA